MDSEQDFTKYICKIMDKEGNLKGTGFFILPGYVATCYHVVEDCKENVSIGIWGKNEVIPGEIIRGEYELYDIAVLKINHKNCDILPLNSKYKLGKINSHGFSIQHPSEKFEFGFPMMSDLIGTTIIEGGLNMLVLGNAEVDYGMSGAPAIDENRTVIGIIRMKYQEGKTALAIPADNLLKKWRELKNYHESLQKNNEPVRINNNNKYKITGTKQYSYEWFFKYENKYIFGILKRNDDVIALSYYPELNNVEQKEHLIFVKTITFLSNKFEASELIHFENLYEFITGTKEELDSTKILDDIIRD